MKQRKESIDQFTKGNRPELAEKETKELAIIESYLPAGASEAEMDAVITKAISETGANSMKLSLPKTQSGDHERSKARSELWCRWRTPRVACVF